MPGKKITTRVAAILLLTIPMIGSAEVVDASSNGFTVRSTETIAADRLATYVALVSDIGYWWNGDHTVSANAANMYFDTSIPGCFCETLGQGTGLVHMTVTFVNPGVMLRLTGGLGPLGLMGVAGNMTFEFEETNGATTVTLQYAVGGYMQGGLDTVAGPVDGVLADALRRLKNYVETGSPEEPATE